MGGTAATNSSKHWLVWPALILSGFGLVAIVALFVWPRGHGEPVEFRLDHVEDYRLGSITSVQEGRFYLVRRETGEFIALSAETPAHGRCTLPWRPTFEFRDPRTGVVRKGWFRDPCSGSTFDREGKRVFGPAQCDLGRLPVSIVNERVVVQNAPVECAAANAQAPDEPD
jgi:hypothetical protein